MVVLPPFIKVCEERLSLWLFLSMVTSQETLAPGTDAVMVAVPERTPIIFPSRDTLATFGLEER